MTLDRPLTERERDVLEYLLNGNSPTEAALRSQVRVARVLQESDCCATIHLHADRSAADDAPADGVPLIIEARWRGHPRIVRLVTSCEARLSHLELVHESESVAPREFPSPGELATPEWFEADA